MPDDVTIAALRALAEQMARRRGRSCAKGVPSVSRWRRPSRAPSTW
ncbi:hypothetical protein NKG05_26815 [Oerskovia sp. M15]